METLFLSQCGLPRDAKHGNFKISPISSLSSPSATSFSSSETQDELLPELWLESSPTGSALQLVPLPQTSSQSQYFHHMPRYSNPYGVDGYRAELSGMEFSSNEYTMLGPGFHSEAIWRDDSIKYAQSLLPHSLLFPLAEGTVEEARNDQARTTYKYDAFPKTASSQVGSEAGAQKRSSSSRNNSVSSASSSNSLISLSSLPASGKHGQGGHNGHHGHNGKHLNTQLYKTELCVSFMKSGACPYGEKCQFAHGEKELKAVNRPSNWRSKPCANWARYGSCRYSIRCCFKHGP